MTQTPSLNRLRETSSYTVYYCSYKKPYTLNLFNIHKNAFFSASFVFFFKIQSQVGNVFSMKEELVVIRNDILR